MNIIKLEDLEHNGIGTVYSRRLFFEMFGETVDLNLPNWERLCEFGFMSHLWEHLTPTFKTEYSKALVPIENEYRDELVDATDIWRNNTMHTKDTIVLDHQARIAYERIDRAKENALRQRKQVFLTLLLNEPDLDSPR